MGWRTLEEGEEDEDKLSFNDLRDSLHADTLPEGYGIVDVGLELSCTIADLHPDTMYEFSVIPYNSIGPGIASEFEGPIYTLGPPTVMPEDPMPSEATPTSVVLRWTENELGDHDAPITGYFIGWRAVREDPETGDVVGVDGPAGEPKEIDAGNVEQFSSGNDFCLTVNDLAPDTLYQFYIKPYNSVGVGPEGDNSEPVWTLGPPTVPCRPPVVSSATTTTVKVSWEDAELGDHDEAIHGYSVGWQPESGDSQAESGEITCGASHEAIIEGLHPDTSYVFFVRAYNSVGKGPEGELSSPIWTLGPPTVPPSPPTPSNASTTSIDLAWEEPELGDHDEAVGGYVVCWDAVEGGEEKAGERDVGNQLSCTITGLIPDTEYVFRVKAYNTVGMGPVGESSDSLWTQGPPTVPPGAPQVADATTTTVNVSWEECELGDHDEEVKGYIVCWRGSEGKETDAGKEGELDAGDVRSVTVTGLSPDTSYEFYIRGYNTVGVGPAGEASDAIWTLGPPTVTASAPAEKSRTTTSVDLSWEEVELGDHDAPITGYVVGYHPKDEDSTKKQGEVPIGLVTSCTVSSLSPDTFYVFYIRAVNSVGTGPVGARSEGMWTLGPPTVPISPPVVANASTSSVEVEWQQPQLGDHDEKTSGYIVQWKSADESELGASGEKDVGNHLFATIQNLLPDSPYVFTVKAYNSVGQGPPGKASDAIWTLGPPTVPPPPPRLSNPTTTTLEVEWEEPELGDHDEAIHGFLLCCKPADDESGEKLMEVDVGARENYFVEGLQPDTSYVFFVRAYNSVGKGPEGELSSPIWTLGPPTVPPSPPTPSNASTTSIDLAWEEPELGDHDEAVGGYVVCWDAVEGGEEKAGERDVGNQLSCTITGLIPDTEYVFRVKAYNTVGMGPVGESSDSLWTQGPPTVPPGAPQVADATTTTVNVSWEECELGDHDEEVKGYIVCWRGSEGKETDAGKEGELDAGDVRSVTVTGLSPDTSYEFYIRGYNTVGVGPAGETSTSITTLGAPTICPTPPSVHACDLKHVVLKWMKPKLGPQDEPPNQFVVRAKCSAKQWYNGCEAEFEPLTGPGELLEGTDAALLEKGKFDPASAPSPCPSGEVTSHEGWEVTVLLSQAAADAMAQHTRDFVARFPGLLPNMAYRFTVQAVNSVGAGPESDLSTWCFTHHAPVQAGGPPTVAERSPRSITLQWTEQPVNEGEAAVTRYEVELWRAGRPSEQPFRVAKTSKPETQLVIQGLKPGGSYIACVRAVTPAGKFVPDACIPAFLVSHIACGLCSSRPRPSKRSI